jgi:hypothetical protein
VTLTKTRVVVEHVLFGACVTAAALAGPVVAYNLTMGGSHVADASLLLLSATSFSISAAIWGTRRHLTRPAYLRMSVMMLSAASVVYLMGTVGWPRAIAERAAFRDSFGAVPVPGALPIQTAAIILLATVLAANAVAVVFQFRTSGVR